MVHGPYVYGLCLTAQDNTDINPHDASASPPPIGNALCYAPAEPRPHRLPQSRFGLSPAGRPIRQPFHLVDQGEGENRQSRAFRGTGRLAGKGHCRASPPKKDPRRNASAIPSDHACPFSRYRPPQSIEQESFAPYLSAIRVKPLHFELGGYSLGPRASRPHSGNCGWGTHIFG